MKLFVLGLALAVSAGKIRREEGETEVEPVEMAAEENGETAEDIFDLDDDEYDMSDYYDEEYGSGEGIFGQAVNWGKGMFNNMFGGEDEDDFEASGLVDNWWETWKNNDYDSDLYSDDSDETHVTRYPQPNLNAQGHIDMSEFGVRDTLDEYFDIFVIILSASILLLLGCAAVSRIRNIRYLKKQYGDARDTSEEGAGLLKNSD